jgi:hypothetical protein
LEIAFDPDNGEAFQGPEDESYATNDSL